MHKIQFTKLASALFLTLFTVACTIVYVPEEYKIAEKRISPFEKTGSVFIENIQLSEKEEYVYRRQGTKATTTMKAVSGFYAEQMKKELEKRGFSIQQTSPKQIKVNVSNISGSPGSFNMQSVLRATLTLGNGKSITIVSQNSSPNGLAWAFNGNIAIGVIDALNHPEVRQYLME